MAVQGLGQVGYHLAVGGDVYRHDDAGAHAAYSISGEIVEEAAVHEQLPVPLHRREDAQQGR